MQKQPRVILEVCGKDFLPGLTFTVAGKKYFLQELPLRIFSRSMKYNPQTSQGYILEIESSIQQIHKRVNIFPVKIYKRATQIWVTLILKLLLIKKKLKKKKNRWEEHSKARCSFALELSLLLSGKICSNKVYIYSIADYCLACKAYNCAEHC